MVSVQKTIYKLLGIGPLNLEDALAADLSDMFTEHPKLEPYSHVSSDTGSSIPTSSDRPSQDRGGGR